MEELTGSEYLVNGQPLTTLRTPHSVSFNKYGAEIFVWGDIIVKHLFRFAAEFLAQFPPHRHPVNVFATQKRSIDRPQYRFIYGFGTYLFGRYDMRVAAA